MFVLPTTTQKFLYLCIVDFVTPRSTFPFLFVILYCRLIYFQDSSGV